MAARRIHAALLTALATLSFVLVLAPATVYATTKPAVSAGGLTTVGLKSDGTVVAAGINSYGQMDVSAWSDIVAVSEGGFYTIGLKSDGTVVAVGDFYGSTLDVSSWSDIVAVSAGERHAVGLKSDGTVVAVGSNFYGQTDVSSWTDIVAVSAGGYHTVGLKSDGTVVAAGSNFDGQTDVSSWADIVAVSAGGTHTVGLKSDGTVVAVGDNVQGQRNVSSWTDIVAVEADKMHTVGLKSDGTAVAAGYPGGGQTDVSSWRDIVAVSAGTNHTVGLKFDGTVVSVGTAAVADASSWTLLSPDISDLSFGYLAGISQNYSYTGGFVSPVPIVKLGQATLVAGRDYSVSYEHNIDAGTASVIVSGAGSYVGSTSRSFTIVPRLIDAAVVTGVRTTYPYTGHAVSPEPTVTIDGKMLANGTDYSLVYVNNTSAGTASVTITGKRNYAGTVARAFTITPRSVASATVSGIPSYVAYTGDPRRPAPVVTLDGHTLVAGTDYYVSYANNSARGTATVTITGKGNYRGALTRKFQILGIPRGDYELYIGRSKTLTFVGGSGPITWRSSNRKIATVSSTGIVKGLRTGSVKITATRNGVSTWCVVDVVKYAYRLSLSRSVSAGKGYINATVKTASGKPVKNKTVKFYRGSTYLGKAKTNSTGKARIKVKKYHSYKTYKIVVGGNSKYQKTTKSNSLSFTKRVFGYVARDMFTKSVYLKAGTYRMTVEGDGMLSAWCGGVHVSGGDGSSVVFKAKDSGYYQVQGITYEDEGLIWVLIDRFL